MILRGGKFERVGIWVKAKKSKFEGFLGGVLRDFLLRFIKFGIVGFEKGSD